MSGKIEFEIDGYEFYAEYTCHNPSNPTLNFSTIGNYPPEINNKVHRGVCIQTTDTAKQTVINRVKDTLNMVGYDVNNIVKNEDMMDMVKENYE